MFDIMLKVVKGFKALNNNLVNEKTEAYLNKLIKVSKKNGLVEFKEESGETILFYGDSNREMVTINVKETRKGDKIHKINFKNLASEVVKQGISTGR